MAKKEKNQTEQTEQTEQTKKTEQAENFSHEKEEKKPKKSKSAETEKLEEQLSQTNDRLLRTLAEYDNYRKRSQKEKEQAYGDSRAAVLSELLPIMDNFERAASNSDASYEDYRKGIDMIYKQFASVLEKSGVEAFGEKGDGFDPNIHNAVMHVEDENEEENVVTDVFSKGYKLGERVLRPAVVKVAN